MRRQALITDENSCVFELSTKNVDNYKRIIPQLKSILKQQTELLRGAKRENKILPFAQKKFSGWVLS